MPRVEVTSNVSDMINSIKNITTSSGYITFVISGRWRLEISTDKPPRIIIEPNIEVVYEKDVFIVNGIDLLGPLKERGYKVEFMGGPYEVSKITHTIEIEYYYTR